MCVCVSEPAPYCIFDFAICWHQLRNYWGFKYLTSWDIIFTSFTSPLLSAHTAAVGKNLCYTFVRFSICVCPTICISVGTHSVSTHEINVIDPKRWRKSTAHTHVGDVLFLLYSIYLRDYLHLHMWSAVFDQTSCEFNAFLHVTSYMLHEKSDNYTSRCCRGVFFWYFIQHLSLWHQFVEGPFPAWPSCSEIWP